MKVYLRKPRCGVYAEGEYNQDTGHLVVKKGAKVSEDVRDYKSRSLEQMLVARRDVVKDGILLEDIEFNSPSGAGIFVTGRSTNGMVAWKDENGNTLNQILGKDEFI